MNKLYFLILILFVAFSCIEKHKSKVQPANITDQVVINSNTTGDTLKISISKSNLYWKGTKMRGIGKHEGEIALKSGYFIVQNNQLTGGEFIADMQSIGVTDIPEHEHVPRNNLNNHLKSSDFFNVEKYPTSKFEIKKTKKLDNDSIQIWGNLTIKDITKSIVFTAMDNKNIFSAKFTVDRFQWNIAYKGNWVDKTLVDKDFELKIELKKE